MVVVFSLAGCGPEDQQRGPMGTDGLDERTLEQMLSVCAGSNTVPGIDVSHWDGTIDWAMVNGAGVKWAYAKATESTNYTDPTFATNWSGMKSAGVLRGAYHFFHPDVDGTAQADRFIGVMGTLGASDLPPMLDWEVSNGASGATAAANAQAFIDRVKSVTGRPTVIYTSPGLWGGFGVTQSFSSDPMWVAHYLYCTMGSGCCPTMPSGWTTWAMWQWSDKGMVTGVPATAVDLDIFDGTYAQLVAFADGGSAGGGAGGGTGGGGTGGGVGGGGGGGGGTTDGGTGGGAGGGGGGAGGGTSDGGTGGGTSDGGTGGGGGAGGGGDVGDGGTGGAGGSAGMGGGAPPIGGGGGMTEAKGGCGCDAADGLTLWSLALGALAWSRRRRRPVGR